MNFGNRPPYGDLPGSEELPGGRCDYLKLDVQGYELAVLKGPCLAIRKGDEWGQHEWGHWNFHVFLTGGLFGYSR